MTIRLRVEWDNPKHALLDDKYATVELQADGSPVAVLDRGSGHRDFEIPPGAAGVDLRVSFEPQLRAVGDTPLQKHVVLQAHQTYKVDAAGSGLVPDKMPPYMQPHPLIDSKTLSNANGAVLAHVHTQFVDVHVFWRAYCYHDVDSQPNPRKGHWATLVEYDRDHPTGSELRALAYTGGKPLLWFATYPDRLAFPPTTEISCLVFFRPENDSYSRIDQPHHMFRLNRFLLSPVTLAPTPDADYWKADQIIKAAFPWLRAGFEQAIVDSGRHVVLLQPWPSGLDFGDAAGKQLPNLVFAALRLLWAESEIAMDRFDLQLGRLGLSGYSAGGTALWQTLRANVGRVSEIYAFDAADTDKNPRLAASWFQQHDDARLRMSGGYTFAPVGCGIGANLQVAKRIGDTSGRVSVMPGDPREYLDGSIPHWVYATALHPGVRPSGDYRHQFAIFGSYPGKPAPPNTTFLQQFLEASGF
jgi:hypothetical protein